MTDAALSPENDLDLRARAQAKLVQRQRTNDARYAADPWAFLTEAVYTLDQASGQVRKFPGKEHLRLLVARWVAKAPDGRWQYPLLAVPKSRRMQVTWLFVALHYWLMRFTDNVTIAFISRKQGKDESEGSAELVRRVKFIHEHLPPDVRRPPFEYKFCRFTFPEHHSEIIGIGQGPDQARQLTISAAFCDEMAFWEWAKDTFIALKPTTEGGGRITAVSTANPGFFKQLVFDEQ